MNYEPKIERVATNLKKTKKQNSLLVGIDGGGGSGKSTFAKILATLLPGSIVVHVDDFYKPKIERVTITEDTPVHSNFDRKRLKEQLLEPLKNGQQAHYQKYNWDKDAIGSESETIPVGKIVIVEGLGTLSVELAPYFDYKIWIDAAKHVRRQRGIERDTEQWTDIWDNEYIPQDERYIAEHKPQEAADIIVKS